MPTQPAVLGSARLNNFRLNYLTAAQAAERPAKVWIKIGGIEVTQPTAPTRVIYKSVQIRDVLFDAPNTCSLTLYGAAPSIGAPIEVWVDANNPTLLFSGELQTVDRTYNGRPETVLHPVTAIDDTARANRRRPLLRFVNVSATTIAQTLIATYAPGFSSAGVEGMLPAVSITFDGIGSRDEGVLDGPREVDRRLLVSSRTRRCILFVTPPGTPPDPIDDTPGRFLHDPTITWSADKSQVRTRVYGKGASTRISTLIYGGTDLVPVENGEMFNPVGGQAIAAAVPDGAAFKVLTYTGVQLGSGGGLVGPGASPSAPPALSLADGAGVESGVHKYAVTFTTAAGETAPSPIGTIPVGVVIPPAAPPTPGAAAAGGNVDPGEHSYAVTFVTAIGETVSSPGSAPVTTLGAHTVPAPTVTPSNVAVSGTYTKGWNIGDVLTYRVTFVTATGETTAGPFSPGVAGAATAGEDPAVYLKACRVGLQVSTDPAVTGRRLYRYKNGALVGYQSIANNTLTWIDDYSNVVAPGVAPPATNTAVVPGTNYQTVPLSGIPIGPANVTGRRLYRSSGGAPYKLLTTIANNTATTYSDTIPNASLGAGLPTNNTALANQVRVAVAIGGSGVTGRKIYRSKAGLDPLLLAATIGENVSTIVTDVLPDASLGAAPPATDTSGLTQPSGQVPAGATSIIVANTAPFPATGGWAVVGNGEQVIRYTGKTATALTGIPASGPGAIVASISYNSTITAAPALVGVTGLDDAVIRNSPIHVWVQRDDPAAQAYMQTVDGGGDGVYEHIWSDERRTEASLIQVCDAQLELYSRPLVTVTYASRDTKTKSGKTVAIALASPAINETLTIQDVAITDLGVAPGLKPKFTVTASNVHHSFDAVLRMLLRKADA